MPVFISKFLEGREFRVRIGSTLSDVHHQEMGVPQGSLLSVTLFSLKINSIVTCLTAGVGCLLYVDDFLACCKSRQMRSIERQLQQCLNNLQTWADQNGFIFSHSKTVCIHFTNANFIQIRFRTNPGHAAVLSQTIAESLKSRQTRLMIYMMNPGVISHRETLPLHKSKTNCHTYSQFITIIINLLNCTLNKSVFTVYVKNLGIL